MSELCMFDFESLYLNFHLPIAHFDCAKKCSPYNEHAIPFCCDTNHIIPSAYEAEWNYLKSHTDLWHLWTNPLEKENARMNSQLPSGQVLIECLGHTRCQREYRSLTCRAFPFFPYIDKSGNLLGLSYYWIYADRCWIISHLEAVSIEFRLEFISAYENLFIYMPSEKAVYHHHSTIMRRLFGKNHRAISLLHRNGNTYKISPRTGLLRKTKPEAMPKYGPYKVAERLPFPDELL